MGWRPGKFLTITSIVGTVIGGTVIFRGFLLGHKKEVDKNIRADGKVIIVTGSNTGIGKETVRELAKRGGIIYMACRDLERCNKAREEIIKETLNRNIYCRKCDLSDLGSVKEFVKEFKEKEERLDILINNAGVMRINPKTLTKQGIEMQIGVNHFGHFLLTDLLMDYLKKSAPSRIVNVSSIAHVRGRMKFEDLNSEKSYDPADAYSQSKLANVLFTKELAKRLKGTEVTVNSLHPGIVNTEIGRHMGISNSFFGSYIAHPILSLILKSPQQGSLTSIYVALDPSLEGVSGKYFSDCAEKEVAKQAEDEESAKRLWLVSEKWTKMFH